MSTAREPPENRERVTRELLENLVTQKQRPDLPSLKDEITVINHLPDEVQVSMNHGVMTLDMTKNKPPVIVMLMPGMSRQKFDKLARLDFDTTAASVKRPNFGTR
jgi:hypothetical protein